jgi:hypothetical protein
MLNPDAVHAMIDTQFLAVQVLAYACLMMGMYHAFKEAHQRRHAQWMIACAVGYIATSIPTGVSIVRLLMT